MPDLSPVVTVRNLSKKYCAQLRRSLWYGLCDIAAEAWPGPPRAKALRPAEFWSLRDVSFELGRGEALAVIGANGAGKSTLLKLLNGLVKPDAGSIRMLGRVGALIELGVGLDPVLTGRENIFLRAALLGVSRAQVVPLLPAIIEFTGLGAAIEMPVQFYSSGMTARLAYAVAAHLQPDVLLVDEVLAVGDFDFQRKCINHMRGYLARGGTLILVSHQPFHIHSVCQRGLVLEKGEITYTGTAADALDYYFARQQAEADADPTAGVVALSELRPVAIEDMQVEGPTGEAISTGDEVVVSLTFQALREVASASWAFYFYSNDGQVCISGAFRPWGAPLPAGRHTLRCHVPRLPLTGGDYLVRGAMFDYGNQQPMAQFGWENAPARLKVQAASGFEQTVHHMLQQLSTIDVEWNR